MKIVNIFANKLFSFHYDDQEDNEYDRLMDLWNDTEYVRSFLKENERDIPYGNTKISDLIKWIREDAISIDDQLVTFVKSDGKELRTFFKPLVNSEYQFKVLSLQKGRRHYLRLYAIKVDEGTFVITGGAIKLHHLMEDRLHTQLELSKLKCAQDYLKKHGVFDCDSFFEYLSEQML